MSAPTLDNPSLSWTSCSAALALSAYATALASAWNSAQALAADSNTAAASKNRPADPSRTSCSASMIARRARARDVTSHFSRSFICAVAVASSPVAPQSGRPPSVATPIGARWTAWFQSNPGSTVRRLPPHPEHTCRWPPLPPADPAWPGSPLSSAQATGHFRPNSKAAPGRFGPRRRILRLRPAVPPVRPSLPPAFVQVRPQLPKISSCRRFSLSSCMSIRRRRDKASLKLSTDGLQSLSKNSKESHQLAVFLQTLTDPARLSMPSGIALGLAARYQPSDLPERKETEQSVRRLALRNLPGGSL